MTRGSNNIKVNTGSLRGLNHFRVRRITYRMSLGSILPIIRNRTVENWVERRRSSIRLSEEKRNFCWHLSSFTWIMSRRKTLSFVQKLGTNYAYDLNVGHRNPVLKTHKSILNKDNEKHLKEWYFDNGCPFSLFLYFTNTPSDFDCWTHWPHAATVLWPSRDVWIRGHLRINREI